MPTTSLFIQNTDTTTIEEVTVTAKPKGDYVNTEEHGMLHIAYIYPKCVREELQQILDKRAALKKAYDDSMSLIFQLRNAIARGERPAK